MRRGRTANPFYPILAAWVFVSVGCSPGLLNSLERTSDDPVIVSPKTVSLAIENRVDVSWDEDTGADFYVLQRASDTSDPSYRSVYQGRKTAYADVDLDDQARYLYRLIKVRGTRSFGPSDAVLGVSSMIIRDGSEPNDEMSDATELTYDRVANLYYYRSNEGHVVQDTDWYYVTIPPQYRAYIVVTQEEMASGASSFFSFYQHGGVAARRIASGIANTIENLTYVTDRFYFKVFPFADDFVSDSSGAGGTLVNYTVSLCRVEKL